MIVVMSPAKTLNMGPVAGFPLTAPHFTAEAAELAGICGTKSASDLKKIAPTKISDSIASLNEARFKEFDAQKGKQAALAFDGPAYRGLNAGTLTKKQIAFAQAHLRILCGLYGILRPFDEIKPFRLEMGSKMDTPRGSNLYQYWGDGITRQIDEEMAIHAGGKMKKLLINCASQEYWKSVRPPLLDQETTEVITCEFPGPSVFAKRARGLMVRYIIEEEVSDAEQLKGFTGYGEDSYAFDQSKSGAHNLCFIRKAGGGGGGKKAAAAATISGKEKEKKGGESGAGPKSKAGKEEQETEGAAVAAEGKEEGGGGEVGAKKKAGKGTQGAEDGRGAAGGAQGAVGGGKRGAKGEAGGVTASARKSARRAT